MRLFLTYALLLFFCFACTQRKTAEKVILDAIPDNTVFAIQINEFESLKTAINSNEPYNKLQQLKPLNKIASKIEALHFLNNQTTGLLTLTAKDSTDFDFTYITLDSVSLIDKKITDKSIESIPYNSNTIISYQLNDVTFYSTPFYDYTILSSSQTVLKSILSRNENMNTHSAINEFLNTANKEKLANIWIDLEHGKSLLKQLFPTDLHDLDFASWLSVDITLNDQELQMNGVALPSSKTKVDVNLFNDTKPISNTLWNLIPNNATTVTSFGFQEYAKFIQNKNTAGFPVTEQDSLLYTVEEIGLASYNDEEILFLKTFGTASLVEYINTEKTSTNEFSGHEILQLTSNLGLFSALHPLTGNLSFNYASIIDNTIVFTKTKDAIETVISKINTENTFDKTTLFKNVEDKLTSTSSKIRISTLEAEGAHLQKTVSSILGSNFLKSDLKDYVFASQLIADTGFFHVNFLIKKITEENELQAINPVFETKLETDLATLPQFVTNHNNGKKEIVVQDQENILYLISASGKILWEKQLNSTIQGKIHQVDLFKNGKLQMAFTTNNEFLILDRNGNEVKPFTFTFSGGNVNPLAVYDYEGRKDYRFVVTQNNKVYMYNKKGEIVKGFKYTTAEANIEDTPQYFRVGRKDYLVFKLDNGKLKILNRVGKTRVSVNDKFSFSDNAIRLYQNKFTFTTVDGILYQIDTKGKVSSSNLSLAKDHGMDATSKTLAIMNDNILRIRDKKVELELGVYSQPVIFYLNDKIYVSVTDIQNQKIYVFDSQAKPISGFPVFGSSIIDMADNGNKKVAFVFKDQENSFKVYKMR
ncbi:ribonuclease HII [Maribacter sp. LLG6340-A2]|uniref:ribonuclease HII n=1 Tax=Maribacter sp. LLG6340-A2 TaxID=3160834 RepID=UPI00386D4778